MPNADKQELIYRTLVSVYHLLMERLPPPSCLGQEIHGGVECKSQQQAPPDDRFNPDDDELMTVREAYLELNVSRTTIDKLRRQGDLTSVYFNNQVRLLRAEVVAAKTWYSQMKGKL